jgi:hypothetical protein
MGNQRRLSVCEAFNAHRLKEESHPSIAASQIPAGNRAAIVKEDDQGTLVQTERHFVQRTSTDEGK